MSHNRTFSDFLLPLHPDGARTYINNNKNIKTKRSFLSIVTTMMVAMPVLVSCDKKQIRNDTDHQTPTSGQMVYNIEVTDDLLSLSDLTVTYYDGTGSTSTQTISETVTSLKITGNLPLKTGFKVSGKKKGQPQPDKRFLHSRNILISQNLHAVRSER